MSALLASRKIKGLLAAALFLTSTVLLSRQLSSAGPLDRNINFVCVATGETFSLARSEVVRIPEINPRTGEATLVPCSAENSVLTVNAHYRPIIEDLAERNQHVDAQSLVVRSEP